MTTSGRTGCGWSQGSLLLVDIATIPVQEADEPNAVLDCLEADGLAGQDVAVQAADQRFTQLSGALCGLDFLRSTIMASGGDVTDWHSAGAARASGDRRDAFFVVSAEYFETGFAGGAGFAVDRNNYVPERSHQAKRHPFDHRVQSVFRLTGHALPRLIGITRSP